LLVDLNSFNGGARLGVFHGRSTTMKSTLLIAAVSLALAAAVQAAPAAPPNYSLPQAYNAYTQPDVTQCQSTGPLERDCTVPAMTAGRYLIVAATDATSAKDDATQSLTIKLGEAPCVTTRPVAFTGKKGLRLGCVVNLLTDQPIVVAAVFATHDATPSSDGPKLVFQRLPWTGIVQANPVTFRGAPAAAAPSTTEAPKG
jgi:hypothetical protein